jgi:hypothetical protein
VMMDAAWTVVQPCTGTPVCAPPPLLGCLPHRQLCMCAAVVVTGSSSSGLLSALHSTVEHVRRSCVALCAGRPACCVHGLCQPPLVYDVRILLDHIVSAVRHHHMHLLTAPAARSTVL